MSKAQFLQSIPLQMYGAHSKLYLGVEFIPENCALTPHPPPHPRFDVVHRISAFHPNGTSQQNI